MRISTQLMFKQSATGMNHQQAEFLKTGRQLASGQRLLTPSDDPLAATRALNLSQAQAVMEQHATSRISARNTLSQEESVLDGVVKGISSAKALLVQAGSDVLSDTDRQAIASELRGIHESLLSQANIKDGSGRYLLGGHQDSRPPFAKDANGEVSYQGDANIRSQLVDADRQMPMADNGATIFVHDDGHNLFNSIESAIGALEMPNTDESIREINRQALVTAGRELDEGFENVLGVRASVGSRLNELDALDAAGDMHMLQYKQAMSELVDVDYNQAITDYSMQQVGLQAAQKAFMGIKSLSLFDML